MANIDVKELNSVFAAALPKFETSVKAKTAERAGEIKAMGIAGIKPAAIELPPGVTFCGSWPTVRTQLNRGISMLSWFLPPAQIVVLKAWMTTADFFVAKICGPQA